MRSRHHLLLRPVSRLPGEGQGLFFLFAECSPRCGNVQRGETQSVCRWVRSFSAGAAPVKLVSITHPTFKEARPSDLRSLLVIVKTHVLKENLKNSYFYHDLYFMYFQKFDFNLSI